MGNQKLHANFLGCYTFKSKDKTKDFFKLQAVAYEDGSRRALLIDTFITSEEYERLFDLTFFDNIELDVIPNFSTGQIRYKLTI